MQGEKKNPAPQSELENLRNDQFYQLPPELPGGHCTSVSHHYYDPCSMQGERWPSGRQGALGWMSPVCPPSPRGSAKCRMLTLDRDTAHHICAAAAQDFTSQQQQKY